MPSLVKSHGWFVRITLPHQLLATLAGQLEGWVDLEKLLVLFHKGEKTEKEHCHFTIKLSSELQKQSFDTRIRKIFPVKGADYSSKPWDMKEEANAYMFHENGEPFLNKGYNSDEIARFRLINQQTQKVVAVNKEKGSKRVVERVVERIATIACDRFQILKILLTMIREGDMYEPGDYKLKQLVEEIYLKHQTPDDWDNYITSRYNNLYR